MLKKKDVDFTAKVYPAQSRLAVVSNHLPVPCVDQRKHRGLQTGAAWRFLPGEFPSPATCWRRLKQWQDEGVWLDAWRALLGALDAEGLLKWDETVLDGSFAPAKKGRRGW